MPIMTTQITFLKSFLFHLLVHGEATSAMACVVDPFTGTLWIGRAHSADRPVFAKLLDGNPPIDIQLLSRERVPARTIRVQYESFDWQPIHLDARRDDVAMEWVGLVGARYSLICGTPQSSNRKRILTISGLPDGSRTRIAQECDDLLIIVENPLFDEVDPGEKIPELPISIEGW